MNHNTEIRLHLQYDDVLETITTGNVVSSIVDAIDALSAIDKFYIPRLHLLVLQNCDARFDSIIQFANRGNRIHLVIAGEKH
jgi:hypothetical protein